jgi:iron(III) transport system substrate-binding protein
LLSVRKAHGWSFFEKLAKNNPRIGRSLNDPVTLITAGEATVGPAPANATFPSIAKGNPLGIVHPQDGCSLCGAPSPIPAGAPHPNAARVFLDWLLSDTYSQLSIDRGSEALRPGLTPKPGHKRVEYLPLLQLTVAEIRTGAPEVVEQWRDTFGS